MRRPGRGVTAVAIALALAAAGGGLLSRSLLRSGASNALATQAGVLVLLNQQRTAHGLRRLTVDAKLTQAADSHSASMLRRGYFAHNGPQGKWDVRLGRYVKSSLLGEILAYGTGPYATADGMVTSWMHSPEHRRVILTPGLRLVGIGIVTGTYRGQAGVAMATGDFSSTSTPVGP
jgi:uncharacterized protein YkwD